MKPTTVTKSVLSLLLILVVFFIYMRPKPSQTPILSQTDKKDFGHDLIEDLEEKSAYGKIEIEASKSSDYGYIGVHKKATASFGKIDFDNRLDDSLFVQRVEAIFKTKAVKVFKNGGIAYALVNDKQIYIENIALSEVVGFNGPINLAVVINREGVLDSMIYLSSEETPSYLKMLFDANYFTQFFDLELDENHQIEAVSGATISSVATAKAVGEIFRLSQQKILADYLMNNKGNFVVEAKLNKLWVLNLALLILVFGVFSFQRYKKKKLILGIAAFTVLWLGFYLNASFTYILFIKAFTTTSLSIFTVAYILLVLFSTIWSKNTYCKYICPFGNVQVLLFKYSPFKHKKVNIKNKHLKYVRYLLSFFIVIGYLSGFSILSEYELFPYFFSINASYLIFGISVLVLLLSMRIPKLWCRALCPTGCVLDSLSELSEHKLNFK